MKQFLVIIFAALLNIGSFLGCVTEHPVNTDKIDSTKDSTVNPPKDSTVDSTKKNTIDLIQLHSYTKIKVMFSGVIEYAGSRYNDTLLDTIDIGHSSIAKKLSYVLPNLLPTPITWDGWDFILSSYLTWDTSQDAPYPTVGLGTEQSLDIRGHISQSTNQLDSSFCHYTYHSYYNSQHVAEWHTNEQTLNFYAIPLLSSGQDSLIFSLNNASVRSLVTTVINNSSGLQYGLENSKEISKIEWFNLPPPSIKVIFYK